MMEASEDLPGKLDWFKGTFAGKPHIP